MNADKEDARLQFRGICRRSDTSLSTHMVISRIQAFVVVWLVVHCRRPYKEAFQDESYTLLSRGLYNLLLPTVSTIPLAEEAAICSWSLFIALFSLVPVFQPTRMQPVAGQP